MASGPVTSVRMLPKGSRRDKPQLSCNFCRKRKLRCDRREPCDSCIRCGQANSCVYAVHQTGRTQSPASSTLQERIDQLESLVQSLKRELGDAKSASSSASIASSSSFVPGSENDRLVDNFGRIYLHESETSYVEGNHWTTILDGIADLKEHIRDREATAASGEDVPGPDLFLAHTRPMTQFDILASIPSRPVVDNILAKYFSTMNLPFGLILHRNVFFKQYERFWEDQLDTPIMWVAILFSIMYMVAYFQLFANEGLNAIDEQTAAEYQQIINGYREKIVQCLKLGNYLKGSPHTVEALMFYMQVEYVRSEDTQVSYWIILGTVIRTALKMGFHRDGSHFPQMSVYEAEMRRRIWSLITQFDTLSSSQIGLPRMLMQAQSDTAEPRNLTDDDFDDTTTVLPPPRPPSEHTLAQFLVYKTKVAEAFGKICDFTTSSRQSHYGDALKLDAILTDAYALKPPILAVKPMHKSIMDSHDIITRRLYLALTYRKAQITLHKKFMIPAKTDKQYTYSYNVCIEAALELLKYQSELHEQCQPGRMLHGYRWSILSLIQTDFLLGTTILCFNLNYDISAKARSKFNPSSRDEHQTIITALQGSYAIWAQQQDVSKEARKAMQALTVILSKAQNNGMLASDLLSTFGSESSGDTDQSTQPKTHLDDFSLSGDDASMAFFDFDEYWKSFSQESTIDEFLDATSDSIDSDSRRFRT